MTRNHISDRRILYNNMFCSITRLLYITSFYKRLCATKSSVLSMITKFTRHAKKQALWTNTPTTISNFIIIWQFLIENIFIYYFTKVCTPSFYFSFYKCNFLSFISPILKYIMLICSWDIPHWYISIVACKTYRIFFTSYLIT